MARAAFWDESNARARTLVSINTRKEGVSIGFAAAGAHPLGESGLHLGAELIGQDIPILVGEAWVGRMDFGAESPQLRNDVLTGALCQFGG